MVLYRFGPGRPPRPISILLAKSKSGERRRPVPLQPGLGADFLASPDALIRRGLGQPHFFLPLLEGSGLRSRVSMAPSNRPCMPRMSDLNTT